ncbi:hypothetical protein U9M48_002008 [Paspalum notatum var. saurae]|uniref:Uncharacterized protein n=1 Tax=Paspalum notatum var. saurae TaxID=547442 RepID=A0AAQ3PKA2_PASNO
MGILLVSGKKRYTNAVMAAIHPAKKKKIPAFIRHSMARKNCATRMVNTNPDATVTLCPADRTSSGKISLGTSQLSGPQDQPKPVE